jgi:hypothetical protein
MCAAQLLLLLLLLLLGVRLGARHRAVALSPQRPQVAVRVASSRGAEPAVHCMQQHTIHRGDWFAGAGARKANVHSSRAVKVSATHLCHSCGVAPQAVSGAP